MNRRPLRASAATAATLLALTVLAACGDKDKDEDAEDTNAGDTTSQSEDGAKGAGDSDDTDESDEADDEEVAPPLPDGVEIELLDAGSGDRSLMLLHPEEGQVLTSTMEMTTSTTIPGQGDMEIPMTIVMESTVDEVTDTEFAMTGRFVDMAIDVPGAEGQMDDVLGDLSELEIHSRLTLTGAPIETEIDLPDDADPMMSQMMDQMSGQISNMGVPFPTEPVGEGASWTATTGMDVMTMQVEVNTTYTLEEFDGENYVLAVEVDGTIESGSQQGVEIGGGSQSGSGTSEGSLAVPMPLSMEMTMDQSMSMSAGGQSMDMETSVDITMTTEVG